MTNVKQLEKSLNSLLTEIRALGDADAQTKQRLERLVLDVEGALEHPKDSGAREGLGERLRSSMLAFEASHPRLSGIVSDVLDELGKMGI